MLRTKINRELRAISTCHQALLRAEDEQELLDEICRIICYEAGYKMSWVGYAEHDVDCRVTPMAWAGAEEGYLSQSGLTWADSPEGHRPLGIAIRTGATAYAQNLSLEYESAPWAEHAILRGYRSAIALPLKDERENNFGVLCIYSEQANAFNADEVELLEKLAADLAYGINSLRLRVLQKEAEAQLAASEELFRTLVENSPDYIARYDSGLNRLYTNPAFSALFEGTMEDSSTDVSPPFPPLHNLERYMTCLRQVVQTGVECLDEQSFQVPDGEVRWVNVRFAPEFDHDGQVASVLVISHDITRRKMIEEEYRENLHFLGCMDRINRVLEEEGDIEQIMNKALDEVMEIFECDRVYLEYPCDPDSLTWSVPIERSRPEYPGALRPGAPLPMNDHVASTMRIIIESRHPVQMGPGTPFPVADFFRDQFQILSFMAMALHPRVDRPWQFGIEQCSTERYWSDHELHLFEEIGNRLANELNSLLITRNLRNSEERFRLVFENSPVPIREEDYSAVKTRMNELQALTNDDIEGYLNEHPEIVQECAKLVRITDINRTALHFHEAESKESLLQGLPQIFTPETMEAMKQVIVRLMKGDTNFLLATIIQTLQGRRQHVSVYFAVSPGYEQSLGRVLVSIIDITDQKYAEMKLMESEQLFRALVENTPDFIARYDRELKRVYLNPALQKLFEIPVDQILGKTPEISAPMENPEEYISYLRQVLNTGQDVAAELFFVAPDGLKWVNMRVVPEFDSSGNVTSVLAISRDITDRKLAEDRLRLAASVFANSQEGIMINNAQNRIIDINPSFTRLTGYSRMEAIGQNPRFLSGKRQDREFYAEMWRSINTKGEWQGEIWNRKKSGEVYAELLSIVAVKDKEGKLQHYVGSFTDISVLKQHEAHLANIAHYDTLTGLPNRRLLTDRLEQAMARSRRQGKNLAVCYLDLDGFKPINDQFGHDAGDHVLVVIAHRLQALSRGDDTIARLGGDEFVLLWNDFGTATDCIQAMERLLITISLPILLRGETVTVSASIGMTLYPDDDVDAQGLLHHADHAMYSAKQSGKNRFQVFNTRLEKQISSRMDLLSRIAHGLDHREFELYYQPRIECISGEVYGVEAVLRWNDPFRGLVTPDEFLPIIENDRLALKAGRWVMEEAVRQAKEWNDMELPIRISTSLFLEHLKYRSFAEDLQNAISSQWPEMPDEFLLLEIASSIEPDELDIVETKIKECVSSGIRFSLEDFGIGCSSLEQIKRLSIQELKIAPPFIHKMLDDPADRATVDSIIGIARAFGLRVVAMGVESSQQASLLLNLGCSVLQGPGLAFPMPAHAIEEWYADFQENGLHMRV